MQIRQIQLDHFYPDRHLRLSGLEQGLHVVYATDPQVRHALMGAIPAILFGIDGEEESSQPIDEEDSDSIQRCVGRMVLRESNAPRHKPNDSETPDDTIELYQCGGIQAPATTRLVRTEDTPGNAEKLVQLRAGLTRADYFKCFFFTRSIWETLESPTQATKTWSRLACGSVSYEEVNPASPSTRPAVTKASVSSPVMGPSQEQHESFERQLRQLAESFASAVQQAGSPGDKPGMSNEQREQLALLSDAIQSFHRQVKEQLEAVADGLTKWQATTKKSEAQWLRDQLDLVEQHLEQLAESDTTSSSDAVRGTAGMFSIPSPCPLPKGERGNADSFPRTAPVAAEPSEPTGTKSELDACRTRWQENCQRRQALARQWRALGESNLTTELADRIRRLLAQEDRVADQSSRIKELDCSLTRSKATIASLGAATSLAPTTPPESTSHGPPSALSLDHPLRDEQWRSLHSVAHELHVARRQLKQLVEQKPKDAPASNAVSASSEPSSDPAHAAAEDRRHEASQRVAEWEHRVALDQLVHKAQQREVALQKDVKSLDGQRNLPPTVRLPLMAAFVLGVGLIMLSWLLSAHVQLGILLLGLTSSTASMLIRWSFDPIADCRYHIIHQSLRQTHEQLQHLILDRDTFDARSGKDATNPRKQLDAARRHLVQLEDTIDRDEASSNTDPSVQPLQDVAGQSAKVEQAREKYRMARQSWRRALSEIGLPRHLSPADVVRLMHRQATATETAQRTVKPAIDRLLDQYRDLGRRQGIVSAWHEEADQLIQSLDLSPLDDSTCDLSLVRKGELLRHALEDHQRLERARRAVQSKAIPLRRQAHSLRARGRQLRHALRAETRDHASVHAATKVPDEVVAAQRTFFAKQRIELLAELDRCAKLDSAPEYRTLKIDTPSETPLRTTLAQQTVDVKDSLDRIARRSQSLFEAILSSDHTSKSTDTDDGAPWTAIQDQIHHLHQQWHTIQHQRLSIERSPAPPMEAMTASDAIWPAHAMDQDGGIELIASEFLRQLSADKLTGIRAGGPSQLPLVESRNGDSTSVTKLEASSQRLVYLALWLARLRKMAQQQQRLPIIMDDPLVGFSPQRHHAIAKTLQSYAADGDQLILFTADTQHVELFASLSALVAPVSPLEGY